MDAYSKIDWGLWETLLAVFRAGSYAQAASRLRVDSTTVGRRIKLLEKKMGTTLLLRQDGRLYPTHQCEQLLADLENAYESLRAAEQKSLFDSSGAIWRNLRISAPPFIINSLLAPKIETLVQKHRIRVELLGTSNNISLSRREADIAIRIDDKPTRLKTQTAQIRAEKLGMIGYAIYTRQQGLPEHLPWAGLTEDNLRTSGTQTMYELAGPQGPQFLAYHFDTLGEIVATGIARSMLPCIMADQDKRLMRTEDIKLQQPVWILSHRQDDEVPHVKTARDWIKTMACEKLKENN